MATIKGRSLAGKILGKDQIGQGQENLEDPGKESVREGTSVVLGRSRKEIR